MAMRTDGAARRILLATTLALAVVVGSSACASIPTGGGVSSGGKVDVSSGDNFSVDLPHPPPKNAPKDEILTDFMQAATSPDGDYTIAKTFLTRAAAQKWNPTKNVVIREGSATSEDLPDGSINYEVSTRAQVGADGVYSESAGAPTATYNFEFAKVGGQWRISSLADQTVIARNSFEQVFQPYTLYFFDPSYRYLVPDVRWFPTGGTVQTRIVSALLGGPTGYLQQGAVVTAFPAGAALEQPVTIRAGTASVDLSAQVSANTKNIDRTRMKQQLQTSLRSSAVTDVAVTVRGAPLAITGTGTAAPAGAVNNAPLVRIGKRFGFAPRAANIGRISGQVVTLDATAATVGRDQASAAVLSKGDVYLVTSDVSQPLLVDSRRNLIAPSLDPYRFVWSVPSTNASAIRATGSDGVPHAIVSSIARNTRIVSLDVSHDGTRVLLYLRTSNGPKLELAGILRDGNGVPLGLGPTLLDLQVEPDLEPIDATWVDPMTVAILGGAKGSQSVISYPIGGVPGDPAATSGAVTIAGGSSVDDLRLLESNGQVLQLRSTGWQDLGVRASLLATQQ